MRVKKYKKSTIAMTSLCKFQHTACEPSSSLYYIPHGSFLSRESITYYYIVIIIMFYQWPDHCLFFCDAYTQKGRNDIPKENSRRRTSQKLHQLRRVDDPFYQSLRANSRINYGLPENQYYTYIFLVFWLILSK